MIKRRSGYYKKKIRNQNKIKIKIKNLFPKQRRNSSASKNS